MKVYQAWNPANQDGTLLYPENHQLIKQTDEMKIVDVFIPANQSEKPHTHDSYSVMFVDHPTTLKVTLVQKAFMQEGENLKESEEEDFQEKVVFERKEMPTKGVEPRLDVMEPEPYHYVTNTSNEDYRAVRIELTKAKSKASQFWVSPSDSLFQSSEGVLIGNIGTAIKVKQLVDHLEVSPLKLNGENRIGVWHLSKDVAYTISSQDYEKAYLLKV